MLTLGSKWHIKVFLVYSCPSYLQNFNILYLLPHLSNWSESKLPTFIWIHTTRWYFFIFWKKNFSTACFEKNMTFLRISLHSQVQLSPIFSPIKLFTFPTYTSSFREIRVKLTPEDRDRKHQKSKMGLSGL